MLLTLMGAELSRNECLNSNVDMRLIDDRSIARNGSYMLQYSTI